MALSARGAGELAFRGGRRGTDSGGTAWRPSRSGVPTPPTGPRNALGTLERLQSEETIKVQDAAIVTWPEGQEEPKTRHLNRLNRAGALGGAFWASSSACIFFVPLLGFGRGAATARSPGR